MIKRIVVILLLAGAFLVGYGASAEAWPVKGRNEHRGYFRNQLDTSGDFVWRPDTGPAACRGTGFAIPTDINTKSEFIDFVICKLDRGSAQERVGAAFIIQTMLGEAKTCPNSVCRPPDSDITEWETRIMNPSLSVNWNSNRSFTVNSFYQGCCGDGSDPVDDAFYPDNGSGLSIVFGTGSGAYVLRRQCANPVGNGSLGTLPDAPQFNMGGNTEIQNSTTGATTTGNMTVQPGERIRFRHYLRNTGPDSTSPATIDWVARNTNTGIRTGDGNAGTFSDDQRKNVFNEPFFTIPLGAAAGSQHCRRIEWNPENQNGGNDQGTIRCAVVAAAYDLVPVTSADKTTVQDGDTVTFTFTVDNTGANNSPSVNCTVNGSQPGGIPGPPSTSCPQVFTWNAASPTVVATQTVTISGQPAGSRICRSLTVNPATPSGNPRTSTEVCVTIVKTPFVHFLSGDVWAGGGFTTVPPGTCGEQAVIETRSRRINPTETAGSGVTHVAFALGQITQFGSASKALVGGEGQRMTFSNTNATELGNFGAPQHCIDDYAANYQSAPAIGGGTIDVGAAGSGAWRVTGNATFHGNVPNGSRKVYLVQGDATISSNITYSGSYANSGEIPSLVIISVGNTGTGGSIQVEQGVQQMDGIYVTRGTFFTCFPKTEPATAGTCNQQLTVNGAVKARSLDLHRTFGSEGGTPEERQRPAEVFNLQSEVYLRNALNMTSQTTITTDSVRELPPRF